MTNVIIAAATNNVQQLKQIIYSGWIYPRLVLSRFYNKSNFDIRKNISEFVGLFGVNLDDTDLFGQTALHYACQSDNHICAELLLKFGANINIGNTNGSTALYKASQYGNPKCVELLLKFGANIDGANKYGYTALHLASAYRRIKCLKILMKYGANPNAKNNDGQTPLQALLPSNTICRDILRKYTK